MGAARGLAYLHEMSLVHGDVKPENIVVSEDLRRVKIIDFGSAGGEDSPTKEGTFVYSLLFCRAEGTAFPLFVDFHCFFSPIRVLLHFRRRKTGKKSVL